MSEAIQGFEPRHTDYDSTDPWLILGASNNRLRWLRVPATTDSELPGARAPGSLLLCSPASQKARMVARVTLRDRIDPALVFTGAQRDLVHQ